MTRIAEHMARLAPQFVAWWQCRNQQPLLYVPAPWPPPAGSLPATPAAPEDNYLNADTIAARYRALARAVEWHGTAFPQFSPFPPAAAFFGAHPVFTDRTIWHEAVLTDVAEFANVRFHEELPLYRQFLTMLNEVVTLAEGEFAVAMPNLFGPLDLLESLRGGTQLSMDLVDAPELVKQAQQAVLAGWRRVYDDSLLRLRPQFAGTIACALPVWSPGRCYMAQCDFSAVFSREMFAEFVAPELEAQAMYLDDLLYHLDGPDAARHADVLLKMPCVKAIQWQKGVNGGPTLRWVPLLRRIQAAGKAVLVDCLPHEVEELCNAMAPEGLYIATAASTTAQAETLKAIVARRFGKTNAS